MIDYKELCEQFDLIETEIKKLNPYLNKVGQKKLSTILNSINTLNQYSPNSPVIIEKASILNLKEYKLTKTELYLCVLISLNFTNIEIVHLSNYSANNIRVTIHRICKKLNVENRIDLERFLINSTKI